MYHFMVSEVLDDPELLQGHLMQGFQPGFTVSNLDFKDLTSAELFKEYRLTIVSRIIVWISQNSET